MYSVAIKLGDKFDFTTHIFDDKESLLEFLKYIYSEFDDGVSVVTWKKSVETYE